MKIYPCVDKTIGIVWNQTLLNTFTKCGKCDLICHSEKDFYPYNRYQCKYCYLAAKNIRYTGFKFSNKHSFNDDEKEMIRDQIKIMMLKNGSGKSKKLKKIIKCKINKTHFKCTYCNDYILNELKHRGFMCKPCHNESVRAWFLKSGYHKRKEVRERRNKYINEYVKNRLKNDPKFKFKYSIRQLISQALRNKGYKKESLTYEILGCDFDTFRTHIEKQFLKGMSWENRSEWHLDHIYPVSKARDEQHLIELNHYTNFRPLWASDNMSKSDKIIEHQLKMPI
jgi:hypothetical protein